MKGIFDDWQAQGITSVLHEKKGGYAFNKDSIKALESKSTSNGVQVIQPLQEILKLPILTQYMEIQPLIQF